MQDNHRKTTGRWFWQARARNGSLLAEGSKAKGGRAAVTKQLKKFVSDIRGAGYIQVKVQTCGDIFTL